METRTFKTESGVEKQVHFDDLQYQLLDVVDHTAEYECRGYDANGQDYSGIAIFTCGELEEIVDIEEI